MKDNIRNMNAEALIFDISKKADWRESVAINFPDDPRNARAARILRRLSETPTTELDESLVTKLDSAMLHPKFKQVFSDANRAVGFRHYPKDLNSYLSALLDQLN